MAVDVRLFRLLTLMTNRLAGSQNQSTGPSVYRVDRPSLLVSWGELAFPNRFAGITGSLWLT